jgi:hypothetical protein
MQTVRKQKTIPYRTGSNALLLPDLQICSFSQHPPLQSALLRHIKPMTLSVSRPHKHRPSSLPVAYRGGGLGGSNPPKFRNFDKVPKIKKILLYEMKFLVSNYSCLQNPWLGGPLPSDPRSLCPLSSTEFVEPNPEQNSWVRHCSLHKKPCSYFVSLSLRGPLIDFPVA